MIFFGTGNKKLKPKYTGIKSIKDPDGEIIIMGVQSYFHVYWIPFIPTGTEWVMFCSETEKIIRKEDLQNPNHIQKIEDVKNSYDSRWWTFIGLIIVATFILIGAIAS